MSCPRRTGGHDTSGFNVQHALCQRQTECKHFGVSPAPCHPRSLRPSLPPLVSAPSSQGRPHPQRWLSLLSSPTPGYTRALSAGSLHVRTKPRQWYFWVTQADYIQFSLNTPTSAPGCTVMVSEIKLCSVVFSVLEIRVLIWRADVALSTESRNCWAFSITEAVLSWRGQYC